MHARGRRSGRRWCRLRERVPPTTCMADSRSWRRRRDDRELVLPHAAAGPSDDRHGPRRRRAALCGVDRTPLRPSVRRWGALGARGRRRPRPRGSDLVLNRHVRRAPPVLPGRQHRRIGGQRHGQRRRHARRRAPLSERRLHPRRGLADGRTRGDRRIDSRRGCPCRRHDRDRRHQGRRSWSRRRCLREHHRNRDAPRRCRYPPARADARRCRDRLRQRSATTAWRSCRSARVSSSKRRSSPTRRH